PFGEDNQALPAPGANPARFLGQPRDQTKLDYFGARYLDMHTGRFTGVDPVLSPAALVTPQKFNRYAYAENNPLRFSDPSGLDDLTVLPDPDHPPLPQAYDLDQRGNALCMEWDDECGTAGFYNFIGQYYADRQRDEDGFYASVAPGTQTTFDPNDPERGETDRAPKDPESHFVVVSLWPDGAGHFGHIGVGLDTYGRQVTRPKTIRLRNGCEYSGLPKDSLKTTSIIIPDKSRCFLG
ncbi:MAG TPA: RHS repeat-associated core domain-containing protein, partial [Gemmatimonadaceae bacterium]|nr:RHS repeat-associated core domain-containing protein [Gemmatimonadaceae bacterium]